MTWTCILAPLLGGQSDAPTLAAACALAEPFGATVHAGYCPLPPDRLFAWASEAGLGASDLAIGELARSFSCGEASARQHLAGLDYSRVGFENLASRDWSGLRVAARFADLVVWGRAPARGCGAFASAFRQVLVDEARPVVVAHRPPRSGGLVVIAWDGGAAAARTVRQVLPWLQQADSVVVLTVPHANPCAAGRLLSFLADHSVVARPLAVHARGDVGRAILETSRQLGASGLVAGAFGQTTLRRFMFGGVTQGLLEGAADLALFLSH